MYVKKAVKGNSVKIVSDLDQAVVWCAIQLDLRSLIILVLTDPGRGQDVGKVCS
jgi:hypothetical protein